MKGQEWIQKNDPEILEEIVDKYNFNPASIFFVVSLNHQRTEINSKLNENSISLL